jgi:hypothetical protein
MGSAEERAAAAARRIKVGVTIKGLVIHGKLREATPA